MINDWFLHKVTRMQVKSSCHYIYQLPSTQAKNCESWLEKNGDLQGEGLALSEVLKGNTTLEVILAQETVQDVFPLKIGLVSLS